MLNLEKLKPGQLVTPNRLLMAETDDFGQRYAAIPIWKLDPGEGYTINGARHGVYVGRAWKKVKNKWSRRKGGPTIYQEIGHKFVFGGQILFVDVLYLNEINDEEVK